MSSLGSAAYRYGSASLGRTLVVDGVLSDVALDFSQADPEDLTGSACVLVTGRGCLRNVDVLGPGGLVWPVLVLDGDGARLDHVRARNGQHACIRVKDSTWTVITDCDAFDDSEDIGLNYGIVFADSTGGEVSHCRALVTRHGVAMGGANGAHDVTVSHCHLTSTGANAADAHAGCSGIIYDSCRLYGGADIGGRNNKVTRCEIWPTAAGVGVVLLNLENGEHEISHCRIRGRVEWNQGLDGPEPEYGEIRIIDNVITASGDILLLNDYWGGLRCDVSRNTFRSTGGTPRVAVSGVGDTETVKWNHVRMVANDLGGATRVTPSSRFVTTDIRDNAA